MDLLTLISYDKAIVRHPLMELVHEEVAAFPTNWYRIFPHALDSPQMERLVSTLPPGDELTDLDETTAAFLRYRMQQFEHVK